MIDAVIFDWGGTLTPWHTIDPVAQWTAMVGDDRDAVERLLAAERDVWARCLADRTSARLAEILAAADVEAGDAQLRAYYDWWDEHTYLDPDVPPLFDALHERGLRVGVLSNTVWPRAEHERIFARDGVLHRIDGAVYSSEIAHVKPAPEAFHAALAAVAVDDPRRAVFVGDRVYDDIHGAQAVGMHAVLVPHSDIPAEQRGSVEGEPDAVVQRLADLLDVLDALLA